MRQPCSPFSQCDSASAQLWPPDRRSKWLFASTHVDPVLDAVDEPCGDVDAWEDMPERLAVVGVGATEPTGTTSGLSPDWYASRQAARCARIAARRSCCWRLRRAYHASSRRRPAAGSGSPATAASSQSEEPRNRPPSGSAAARAAASSPDASARARRSPRMSPSRAWAPGTQMCTPPSSSHSATREKSTSLTDARGTPDSMMAVQLAQAW
mmetsp:Transcript_20630/g.60955  ORF Transcript_20630/g.60955 Transcript_20630/m.60955 type:complete len:211 (+) Transcript_20630:1248-1880(+)